jgi:glycosyltransferase involved in cell wall biosynthesis
MCHPWEQARFLQVARSFLKSHLKDKKYDLVHCHFVIPTGILARWIKKKYEIPYVLTSHGSDIPGYNPDRFKALHYLTPPTIRSIIAGADFIFPSSKYLGSMIEKVTGSLGEKLVVMPNGIEKDVYLPGQKEKMILSTGRLLSRKGFQYLIEAVHDIDSGYQLHICGDGPMMDELKNKAEGSLTPVVFHGWINNKSDAYKELLSKASIFSLVSIENSSVSLVEAMSAGCAMITSSTSGCAESVAEAGKLVEHGKVAGVRKALVEYFEDPDSVILDGAKARHRVETKLDWEILFNRYRTALNLNH